MRRNPTGKYFIAVLCDLGSIPKLEPINRVVGVDLGIKDFLILSSGEKITNPKYLHKLEKQLIKWQKGFPDVKKVVVTEKKQGKK